MFYFISITINLYFVRSYRKITTRNLETSILRIRNREFKYTDIKVTQFKRKRNFCLRFVCRQKYLKGKRNSIHVASEIICAVYVSFCGSKVGKNMVFFSKSPFMSQSGQIFSPPLANCHQSAKCAQR